MAGEEHYCDGRRRNLAALPGRELQRQRGKRFKSCTQNSKYDFIGTLLHVRRLKGPSYIFYLHLAFLLKYSSACRKWTYWLIWIIWGKQNLKSPENGCVILYYLSVWEILCIYFFLSIISLSCGPLTLNQMLLLCWVTILLDFSVF